MAKVFTRSVASAKLLVANTKVKIEDGYTSTGFMTPGVVIT